jgi:hypothetical protein
VSLPPHKFVRPLYWYYRLEEIRNYEFCIVFSGIISVPNFMKIRQAFLEVGICGQVDYDKPYVRVYSFHAHSAKKHIMCKKGITPIICLSTDLQLHNLSIQWWRVSSTFILFFSFHFVYPKFSKIQWIYSRFYELLGNIFLFSISMGNGPFGKPIVAQLLRKCDPEVH